MPDQDGRERLRIGGWVPPYRDTRGPLRPPVPPGRLGTVVRHTLPAAFWPTPSPRPAGSGRGRRALLAAATGTLLTLVGLAVLAVRSDDPPPGPTLAQRLVVPPFTTNAPVSVLPSPTPSRRSAGSVTRSPTHRRTTSRPPTSRSRPPTSRPPSTAPVTFPEAGTTIGLTLADDPGQRLRHRDFLARLDAVDARSPRLDRHDSRFTVRPGSAGPGCVSLESVNYPGYFLRHRDFVLRLDRRDRSRLFDQDATFCPRPAHEGAAFFLESVNYPARFLTARGGGVRLDRDRPTAFVPREPV